MRASKQVVQTATDLGKAGQSVSKPQNKFTNYAQFHQDSTPSSVNSSAHIDSALLLQKGAGARKVTAGNKLQRPASAKTTKSGKS